MKEGQCTNSIRLTMLTCPSFKDFCFIPRIKRWKNWKIKTSALGRRCENIHFMLKGMRPSATCIVNAMLIWRCAEGSCLGNTRNFQIYSSEKRLSFMLSNGL